MSATNENSDGLAVFGIINLGSETDDKILLVHDKDKPDFPKFKCPGGRREPGETREQTFYREVLKEEIIGLKIINIGREPFFEKDLGDHWVAFFAVTADGSEKYLSRIKPGEEIDIIEICSSDEVTTMIGQGEILPVHAEALIKYLQECCLPY